MAVAAIAELNLHLPGGAGDYLNITLLPKLKATTENTNNYAPVNLGQLKTVAKPFYTRLMEVGYTTQYPWAEKEAQANDYAMANIGQVKNLFCFDVLSVDAAHDTNHNAIPDWVEAKYNVHDATLDSDGDGVPDWKEYLAGTDPQDAFNGHYPLSKLSEIVTKAISPACF